MYGPFTTDSLLLVAFLLILGIIFALSAWLDHAWLQTFRIQTSLRGSQQEASTDPEQTNRLSN